VTRMPFMAEAAPVYCAAFSTETSSCR
jgi:hypothetical protein